VSITSRLPMHRFTTQLPTFAKFILLTLFLLNFFCLLSRVDYVTTTHAPIYYPATDHCKIYHFCHYFTLTLIFNFKSVVFVSLSIHASPTKYASPKTVYVPNRAVAIRPTHPAMSRPTHLYPATDFNIIKHKL